ncbi:MAG TPA: heme-binding protein [Allosphingosinicella sp.]|nr:heme-binding protein [Allosphingosinicella sp.]
MASTHEVRLHGEEIDFGNLTGLAGNWHGANGFNMIAVPNQEGGFELLVASYAENLIINKVPATTPNRGLTVIENIPTLQYSTTISELLNGALMHVEGGFWEVSNPELNDGFDVFRIASVPHGNAVEAMGTSSVTAGPPVIDVTLNGLPTGALPDLRGYTDDYLFPFKYADFSPEFPNKTLVAFLENQEKNGLKVTSTVTLQVSTLNKGGIANIASLAANANPTQFDATFWLETLEDEHGNTYRQLQYSQRVLIEFPIKSDSPGQTIVWPHINVNTLSLVT